MWGRNISIITRCCATMRWIFFRRMLPFVRQSCWLSLLVALAPVHESNSAAFTQEGLYFPPPGESVLYQDQRTPIEVGLDVGIITDLRNKIISGRWALWRHGYLVHVEGSFNTNKEIKSARKSIHAATVGVALQRGLIPSLDQPISIWNPELSGVDATATWGHVITQTSAFDEPALLPGNIWAYSDANPYQLCRALARVWGKVDFNDHYNDVVADALFDPIGASGWSTGVQTDGIRFILDLEDMGRFGLLMISGGVWNGNRLIPEVFVEAMATKQTYGVPPNYDNDNNGHTGLLVSDFPESPYGYMTWVNTERDLWPAAASTWAVALGSGGSYIAWDLASGVVLSILEGQLASTPGDPPGWPIPIRGIIETIQTDITGPNPLLLPPGPDITPPVRSNGAPGGILPAGTMQATLSLSTDESATCRYDTQPGTDYAVMPFTFASTGGTVHDEQLAGLQDGTAYSYYARCMDTQGNANPDDLEIAFEVAVPGDPGLPVSLWKLDEGSGTAVADMVSGNVGTLQGGGVWAPGQDGSAIAFNGLNGYVSIADHPSLDYSSYAGLTMMAWIRPERLDHTDDQTVFGHWSGAKASRPFQLLLGTDNRWQCITNNGDGFAASVSQASVGVWTHVACRWTPQGLEIYVDGVQEAIAPVSESSLDMNGGLHTLGAREKSGRLTQFFQGALDEVYLYSQALTQAEIVSVMSVSIQIP